MRLSIAIALALLSFSATAAQPLRTTGAKDQAPSRLVALPAPSAQIERAPVSFSWKLDPTQALAATAPYVAQSREYWQTVDAAELNRGLQLKMSAPGSLIRISPTQGARALRTEELQINDSQGAAKVQNIASAKQLVDAGMDVQTGTVIAKLGDQEGADTYTVRVPKAQGQYLVHVFEPQSSDILRAGTDRSHALAGSSLRFDVDFSRAGKLSPALKADAMLVAPDGRSWPVALASSGNGLSANVKLPANVGTAPGLWELQVFADADGIQRDARTSFAVAAPTARFNGLFAFNAKTMRMALPVQTGSAGRYEARGTLFATATDGVMRPVSEAHSAAWMKRGNGMLVLQFDRAHLPQGYGAPFEVRELKLNDQSRMAPLESRERAGIAR
ncbi:MAG: DUF4785 domain-containing protein [Lysobacteraceae bacterium]